MKKILGVAAVGLLAGVPAAHAQSGAALPFELGLIGIFAAGGSSADDETVAALQGGGHDPNRNGFTVQALELTAAGTVDPYFEFQTNIVLRTDTAGGTEVELEEAFLASRALPAGLQVKAGQYYTEFGRHNNQHAHVWGFVDQPLILTRLLGPDGLRAPGARLAWLAPLPWYSEVYFGGQNADGENAVSFLWEPGESVAGHTLMDRSGARRLGDLLWSARWLNGFDLSDTVSANLGVSALAGPNASGPDTNTRLYGADLYVKWKPLAHQRGFPFLAWQTEILRRDYDTPDGSLRDGGGYSQLLWGFAPGWLAGARAEYADSDSPDPSDALRDRRTRYALNLTHHFSEYSKLRLQWNRDRAEHLAERVNSIWLQYEIGIGRHAAHVF